MKPAWTEMPSCRAATCRMRISTASSPPCAALALPARTARPSPRARLRHAGGGASGPAKALADLGEDFGAGLTAAEVDYLARREWARSAEDILWRRSKLGLHVPVDAAARIDAYLPRKSGLPSPRNKFWGRIWLLCRRHRPGHDQLALHRLRQGRAIVSSARRSTSRSIPSPATSSTIRWRSGATRRSDPGGPGKEKGCRPATSPPSASPTSARPR